MDCTECEDDEGEPTRVEYMNGDTETVSLCEQCRGEFKDGGLIREVERAETPPSEND